MNDRTMVLKFAAWLQQQFDERPKLVPVRRSFRVKMDSVSEKEIEVLFRAFSAGYKCKKSLVGSGFVTVR
jgi:hypothetical protein